MDRIHFLSIATVMLATVATAQEPAFLSVPQSRWAGELTSTRAGERRSAAFALGKLGIQSAHLVPKLNFALRDADASVREATAFALGEIGPTAHTEDTVAALTRALKDADPRVRRSAAFALGQLGKEASAAASDLLALLGDPVAGVRQNASFALGRLQPPRDSAVEVVSGLCRVLAADRDPLVRRDTALALGQLGRVATAGVRPLLDRFKNDADVVVRRTALDAVVPIVGPDNKDAVEDLKHALDSKDDAVVRNAALALANVGGAESALAVPVLGKMLQANDPLARRLAGAALVNIGVHAVEAVPELTRALADADVEVRRSSAAALGRIGFDARDALPTLLKLLRTDDDDRARMFAAQAVAAIDPDDKSVVETLLAVLQESGSWIVRHRAIWAMKRLKDFQRPGVIDGLTRILDEKAPEARMLRYEAAHALAIRLEEKAPERAVAVLVEALGDRDLLIYTGTSAKVSGGSSEARTGEADVRTTGAGDWRREVAMVLSRMGPRAARPPVLAALEKLASESPDPAARDAAKAALRALKPT